MDRARTDEQMTLTTHTGDKTMTIGHFRVMVGGYGCEPEYLTGTLEEANERAVEAGGEGDWDTSEGPVYVDVVIEEEGEEEWEWRDSITVTIPVPEPDCEEGEEHDWVSPHELVGGIVENPGVWGHGGGVLILEVCCRCGTYRETDTWAQRRDTGEQGLTEITYREADEASGTWVDERAGELE